MDLYKLKAFMAVAKHHNFTNASRALHLSQPTVSGQIKSLELELGVELFLRKASGVELSEAGEKLFPEIERLLADAETLLERAKRLKPERHRTIKLGTVIDAQFLGVGQLLSDTRTHHPHIKIETHHGLSGWVLTGVMTSELDCGFYVGEIQQPGITSYELTTITYRIAAPKNWEKKIQQANWKEIAEMPWVWAPDQGSYPRIAEDMFKEQGLRAKKVAVADRESTIINLVSSGVGLALLRKDVAKNEAKKGNVSIWKHGSRQVPLHFFHLAAGNKDPDILAIAETVQQVWRTDIRGRNTSS